MEFPDGGEFESQIFLSIQAQDFIEDLKSFVDMSIGFPIPEHSSSGLQ